MTGVLVKHRTVVLGAGRAAEALRQADPDRDTVVIGRKRHPPYERPRVSKALLAGTAKAATAHLHPIGRYIQRGIKLRLGCEVECVDRGHPAPQSRRRRAPRLRHLILATGARSRRLAAPGVNGARLVYLREQRCAGSPGAPRSRHPLGGDRRGLHWPRSRRRRLRLGCAVTVLETAPHALGRVVPREIGDLMANLHPSRDVELRFATSVAAVEEFGLVIGLLTATGDAIAADVAVVGIGAVPNVELIAEAGLAVDEGVLVDEYGRTEDPAIFAVGDVTRHYNPLLGASCGSRAGRMRKTRPSRSRGWSPESSSPAPGCPGSGRTSTESTCKSPARRRREKSSTWCAAAIPKTGGSGSSSSTVTVTSLARDRQQRARHALREAADQQPTTAGARRAGRSHGQADGGVPCLTI